MAEIVNLHRVRRAAARRQEAEAAAANRLKHGVSKADRALAQSQAAQAERHLANARLEAAPPSQAKPTED